MTRVWLGGRPTAGPYRNGANDRYAGESQPRAHPMTRLTLLTLAACLVAGTADAQFNRADPATGETYHVEIGYGWWNPEPTIEAASEGLGIPPTLINFVDDLGIVKKRIRQMRFVGRPAKKHKLGFE